MVLYNLAVQKEKLDRRGFLRFAGLAVVTAAYSGIPAIRAERQVKDFGIDFDKEGIMYVEGKRFFPIVLYGLPGNHNDRESWQKAREMGVNTVTMFFPTDEALDLAEEQGLKTIVRLDYLFPHFTPNDEELERILARKSVIAFEVDEPNDYWEKIPEGETGKNKEQALFDLLGWMRGKSDVPLRVTTDGFAHLIYSPEAVRFLEELMTLYPNVILGPDVYSDLVTPEVASYVDYWGKDKLLNFNYIKSVWSVTSAHAEDQHLFKRDLSREDMLYHAIAGFAAGARGVGYFDSAWGCDLRGCSVKPEENGKLNAYGKHMEDIKSINGLLNANMQGLSGDELYRARIREMNVRITRSSENPDRYFIFWSDDYRLKAGIDSFIASDSREIARHTVSLLRSI